jgi:pimeloyl-ACP methyl ester carboxylesterase
VLSHGNGLAIDAYFPFWRLLAERFEVVLFDIRNHGQNPQHVPASHTWARIARDIGEISRGIDARFGRRTTFGVFHSLSAVTTLLHDLESGPAWAGLVLFDPPLFPPDGHPLQAEERADMDDMTRRARRRPPAYRSVQEFADQLARQSSFRRWVDGEHLLFAEATLKPSDGAWVLRAPRELEAHIYETNLDTSIWPRLPDLRNPMILVGADPDAPAAGPPAKICRAIHQDLGVGYVAIPDTTHFLQVEKPRACAEEVVRFVGRVTGASAANRTAAGGSLES